MSNILHTLLRNEFLKIRGPVHDDVKIKAKLRLTLVTLWNGLVEKCFPENKSKRLTTALELKRKRMSREPARPNPKMKNQTKSNFPFPNN